jgi:type VI secretion system VasD/TssJ family lipoprotein
MRSFVSKMTRVVLTRRSCAAAVAKFAIALSTLAALGGCSLPGGGGPKEAVANVQWSYEENAISIDLSADGLLNQHDGEPHTLLLGVFQFADTSGFQKIVTSRIQLVQMLSGGLVDSSTIRVSRYVVQPGSHATLSIDRAEKARAVGIIAGYYVMDSGSARLFEIPLDVRKKGFFGHDYVARPKPLALEVTLGPTNIQLAVSADGAHKKSVSTDEQVGVKQVVPLDGGGHEIPLHHAGDTSSPDTAVIQIQN